MPIDNYIMLIFPQHIRQDCGSLVWGVEGIFAGVAIANSISGILAWVWFKRILKQCQATEENYERR